MPQRIRLALVIAIMLWVVVPVFGDAPGVVLYSAHPQPSQNMVTLYGEYGDDPVAVWWGDAQLNVVSQTHRPKGSCRAPPP